MKHTPFGYRIENGKAVIDEKEAEQLRYICACYLSGESLENAAKEAGLKMTHSSVRRMITNKKYLGTDYYPQILGQEIYQCITNENERRNVLLNKAKVKKRIRKCEIPTAFLIKEGSEHFDDPFKQAEYVYSLVRSAEKENA